MIVNRFSYRAIIADMKFVHIKSRLLLRSRTNASKWVIFFDYRISTRSQLLQNLQSIKCMIFSIHTFIEDIKWLKSFAKIIQLLFLNSSSKKSSHQAISMIFVDLKQEERKLLIQHKISQFSTWFDAEMKIVECDYHQLWMFAWRHFPDLNTIASCRNIEKRKSQVKLINEQCWQRLTDLTITLDFKLKKAIRLWIQDFDTKMTLEFLRQVQSLKSLISRMKFIWILQTKSVVFYVSSRKSKKYK